MAFRSGATEMLVGGAAGGGKSHYERVVAITSSLLIPGLQTCLVRRKYPELKANHFEGRSSFPALLAELIAAGECTYNASDLSIRFNNGSLIFTRHYQHEKDSVNFHGPEFDQLIVDELTHFTEPMYTWMRSRLRSAGLVIPDNLPPCCRDWTFPRVIAGSNPGGVGHNWVKSKFIDSAEPGVIHQAPDDDGGMRRQYIRALYTDNPSHNPEEYKKKLMGLGNPALVKAMLEGSWDIVAGGMLDDVWGPKVVRDPCEIPAGWRIDRSFDWGSAKPFSVIWWAEADGTAAKNGWCPKKGTLIAIAEWYGWNGKPDQGLYMTAAEIGRGILKMEADMPWKGRVQPGPADSAIFDTENGNCIADDFARVGVRWEKCQKGPGSRINGWQLLRQHLKATSFHPMEEPGLFVFNTCRQIIRTLPTLPRDDKNAEDVDTSSEDHAADAVRYRLGTKKFGVGTVKGF